MKKLFWKTYKIKFITNDRKFYKTEFMRGFTWEVVKMATERAEEKSKKEYLKWAVEDIIRI